MQPPFDSFAMIDWSGGNDTGPRPRKDAIWAAVARRGGGDADAPVYLRNRQMAETWLADLIEAELTAGRRLCLGFDFPFGYPAGFAQALTGQSDPFAVWAWLAGRIEDAPKSNNRFDVAAGVNNTLGQGRGPFWANALSRDIVGLPRTKADYENPFPDRREIEQRARGSFTCWQLAGAGAVGSQVLMGLPVLHRLRARYAQHVRVWPFEPLDAPVAFVEIWPSLTVGAPPDGWIRDAWQVHEVARALSERSLPDMEQLLDIQAPEEGWILGVSQTPLDPPPLRNDCFALPGGVDWTPVDDALSMLRDRLGPVVAVEDIPLSQAAGRISAGSVLARRSNPPQANSAVDGYGFAWEPFEDPVELPLIEGRAAAGVPFAGHVPKGQAIRVLTGASLPAGVDTVVLEEDVSVDATRIAFRGPIKARSNTRKAGEDFAAGDVVLQAQQRLNSPELALLAAAGVERIASYAPLSVAVLSTGDELAEAGGRADEGQIFDANRPMLLELIRSFGFTPVDLGIVPDDRAALAARLDEGATRADAILTSGGASAGDEDHVSALLKQAGAMALWRVAVKPGRPLALGLWQGCPVFGLPGNPVAALVCALIFARPALGLLAGAGWQAPQGFDVPAGFTKRKKAGRREYLRARMREGRAEVFASEGSGRISGLSWAEGLVELPDHALEIKPGDPVRYLPYAGFARDC